MSDDRPTNGVRINQEAIYRLLLETNQHVLLLNQTVREVIHPELRALANRVASLERDKADRQAVDETRKGLDKIEVRLYAMMVGIVIAALGAKGLGIL